MKRQRIEKAESGFYDTYSLQVLNMLWGMLDAGSESLVDLLLVKQNLELTDKPGFPTAAVSQQCNHRKQR